VGLGNTAAAALGGISGTVSLANTFAAYRAGGRTSAASIVNALCVLLAILVLAPALAYLPRAVIAGMLLLIGLQLFDVWSVQVAQRVLTRQLVDRPRMTLDLAVTLLVATLAITVGLVVAVATGVAVAILFFLLKMSKSVVRRAYHADAVHSRKTRPPQLMEALQAHGRQILVLELEGPIFFGTAEDLARRVDAVGAEVSSVILDLKRVNEVDTTGGRLLVQIHRRLASEGKELILAHVLLHEPVGRVLQDVGVVAAVTPSRIFADADRALEWTEDRLLGRILALPAVEEEFPLEHLDVIAALGKAERDVLRGCLTRRSYGKGEVVFREGDAGRELFIIARGAASVRIRLAGDHREKRLATFAAGTIFGEMALLDAGPRSATVMADEDLVCYVLTEEAFAALVRDHHAVAIRLLAALGRELGRRLRRANQTIYQLEA
jgi:anti-anti-sigma regulatory factor